MIVMLYGMKFRVTLFGRIEPSPCGSVLSTVFSGIDKKSKQTFKFFNGTPTSITGVAKILLHFLL